MTKTNSRVQASTTTKTYVYCRIAARDALERADAIPEGSFYFYMMAATFAAFGVEGVLNHIGERKVTDWERIERRFGPREKLLVLQQVLHLAVDESRRPFQTLTTMLRVRDALAHGRTLNTTPKEIIVSDLTDAVLYPQPEWKKMCRPESVARMVKDAELIVRDLNTQVGFKDDPFISPGGGWSSTRSVAQNVVLR